MTLLPRVRRRLCQRDLRNAVSNGLLRRDGHAAGTHLIEAGGIRIPVGGPPLRPDRALTWSIRPNTLKVSPDGLFDGLVLDVVELPTLHEATVQLAPELTLVIHNPDATLRPGTRCTVTIPPDAVRVWETSASTRTDAVVDVIHPVAADSPG